MSHAWGNQLPIGPYIMLWTVSISTNDVHGSNPPSPCEAKNKSWFGCIEAFRMLDSCWTVLSETSRFAQRELDNLDDANEWWDYGDEQGDEDTQPFFEHHQYFTSMRGS